MLPATLQFLIAMSACALSGRMPGTILGWFRQIAPRRLIRNIGPMNDNGVDGKVACRSRLGGLLNFNYREAA
jgi:hypothetical protein